MQQRRDTLLTDTTGRGEDAEKESLGGEVRLREDERDRTDRSSHPSNRRLVEGE